MIGHLYYIIGTIIFLASLNTLARFNSIYKVKEWYYKFKNVTGKEPLMIDFRNKEDKNLFINHNFILLFEMIWITLGLVTNSWYIFASILILSVLLNFIFRKNKFSTDNIPLYMISKISAFTFLLLRTSIYLFLIINHFHLHIDLYDP